MAVDRLPGRRYAAATLRPGLRGVDGFLGTGDANNKKGKPRRPTFNAEVVSQMIGSEAMAKITVMKSKKSDYVGNDISTVTYLGDLEPAAA